MTGDRGKDITCGGLEDLGWSSPREDNGFHITSYQSELENNGPSWRFREDPWRKDKAGSSQGKAWDLGYIFQPPPPLGPRSLHSLVPFLPRTLAFGRRSRREFKQELTFLQ